MTATSWPQGWSWDRVMRLFAADGAPVAPDDSFEAVHKRLAEVVDVTTGEFRTDAAGARLRALDVTAGEQRRADAGRVLRYDTAPTVFVPRPWPSGWSRERADAMCLAAGELADEIAARSDAYQMGRILALTEDSPTGEIRAGDRYRRFDAATHAADLKRRTDVEAAEIERLMHEDALAQPTSADMLRARAEISGLAPLGSQPSEKRVAERAQQLAAARAGHDRAVADRLVAPSHRDGSSDVAAARKMAGSHVAGLRKASTAAGDHPIAKRLAAHATELERIGAGTDTTSTGDDEPDERNDGDDPVHRWKRMLPSAVAALRERKEGR